MGQVAVIQRLYIPTFTTEYLARDHRTPKRRVWTKDRSEAKEFESHEKADIRAEQIRHETGEHVHAAMCQKPIPHTPVPDAVPRTIKREPKFVKVDRFRELQCRRDPAEAL